MAAAAILKFEKVLLFLYYLAKPHQIWKEHCESYVEKRASVKGRAAKQTTKWRLLPS